MAGMEAVSNIPTWMWKTVIAVATLAGLVVSMVQITDSYWKRVDDLVKGSVMQSTLKVSTQITDVESRIGGFLIDGLQFRIIGIQDEIAKNKREGKPDPDYLIRQLNILKDQLGEAKEKWEK